MYNDKIQCLFLDGTCLITQLLKHTHRHTHTRAHTHVYIYMNNYYTSIKNTENTDIVKNNN